jgi:transposase
MKNMSAIKVSPPPQRVLSLATDLVDKDVLERALDSMTRMQEVIKDRVRAHFIDGLELRAIALRDGVSYETVSNAARRVRIKMRAIEQGGEALQLQTKPLAIVKVRANDLEKVLAQMPRMQEQTKERMRQYFLQGGGITSIAAQDGVRVEGVKASIRHVMNALDEQDIAWRHASFTLTLPKSLGKELQALSDNLLKVKSKADAEALLEPIMRQISKANGSLK